MLGFPERGVSITERYVKCILNVALFRKKPCKSNLNVQGFQCQLFDYFSCTKTAVKLPNIHNYTLSDEMSHS